MTPLLIIWLNPIWFPSRLETSPVPTLIPPEPEKTPPGPAIAPSVDELTSGFQ